MLPTARLSLPGLSYPVVARPVTALGARAPEGGRAALVLSGKDRVLGQAAVVFQMEV